MSNALVPLPLIAYFSMEIALESLIPTYSGGLGILAGFTTPSAYVAWRSATVVSS